jgi:hypothetical protein
LEAMRNQANGCCDYGFYDAAAVLCRRLMETTSIECFDKSGNVSAILDSNGNVKQLSDIVAAVKSKRYFNLSRNAPKNIDAIKQVGDTAAHHRYYATKKRDLDGLNPGLAHLLTEICALAGY